MSDNKRVYLEFAVGDVAKYEEDLKQFCRFRDFVAQRGESFGVAADFFELDEEGIQTMSEIAAGEAIGDFITTAPKSPVLGKVIFELDYAETPKTAENFRALCTGEKGVGKSHQKPMHYKGTKIFRIVPQQFLHGGDFTRFDGSGGDSIYNGSFNDEKAGLKKKHDSFGLLSMANSGKNSNTSQFFVTLEGSKAKNGKLDGKHVVFGKIVGGTPHVDMLGKKAEDTETAAVDSVEAGLEILRQVEVLCKPNAAKELPGEDITIVDCGEIV